MCQLSLPKAESPAVAAVGGATAAADASPASVHDANIVEEASSEVSVHAQPSTMRQTVTIFDWDDTILPTSSLCAHLVQEPDLWDAPIPLALERTLRGIERVAKQLLATSLMHGQVFVITNALEEWVHFTACKYLPKLLPLLQKVHIISARARYEQLLPDNPSAWKDLAFLEVRAYVNEHAAANLVSLGDSLYEINAVRSLGRALGWRPLKERHVATSTAGSLVKTVKLQEKPTAEDLRKQLELVAAKFEQILNGRKDLHIGLEKKFPAPTMQE